MIENSDPYWAAVGILKASSSHTVGVVAWGAGKSFPSQVPTLAVDVAGYGPSRGNVWYWGDMDPDGPQSPLKRPACRTSRTVHRSDQLIDCGGPWPTHLCKTAMASTRSQETIGREWLGEDLATHLDGIRKAGGRVAQEAVPSDVIAQWAETLNPQR